MRVKILPVISSLILTVVLATSCLDSKKEAIELSKDATIHSIAIDTVFGKLVPLTIDQVNHFIYNETPLPHHADTVINEITINSINTVGGSVTYFDKEDNEKPLLPTDTLDLRSPLALKVYAMDRTISKEYTLEIKYYKEDPNILTWESYDVVEDLGEKQKYLFSLGANTYVYTEDKKAFKLTNPESWESMDTFPHDESILDVFSDGEKAFLLTESNLYFTDESLDWNKFNISSKIEAILGLSSNNELAVITTQENVKTFASINLETNTLTIGNRVPSDFYLKNKSRITYSRGANKIMMVMSSPTKKESNSFVWMSSDGKNWIELKSTNKENQCPYFEQPHILYYNNQVYAFDTQNPKSVYVSLSATDWKVVEDGFKLPEEFKQAVSTYTVDSKKYIWILKEFPDNKLFKGILNKYKDDFK